MSRFIEGEDRQQFRRVIRYLKRWKNLKFTEGGNSAPLGIGLTIAGYTWFLVENECDYFSSTTTYDDHAAILKFTNSILYNFRTVFHDGEWAERLSVPMIVEPYNDLFGRMTNRQMSDFKDRLLTLRKALDETTHLVDPVEACEILRKEFGPDFPVPQKQETAEIRHKAYSHSSSSG